MKIVAAIHDLMFSSKVNAAAQGKPISWVPRGTAPADHVAKEQADVLLIDLDARQGTLTERQDVGWGQVRVAPSSSASVGSFAAAATINATTP